MDTSVVLYNPNAGADVIRAVNEPAMSAASANGVMGIIAAVALLVLVVVAILFAMKAFKEEENKNKSKNYRTLISDMFVAGKVRSIASEEKVDLDAEYKRFKKWEKKDYLKGTEIDTAVEVNLRDKITEKAESEIDNLK